MKLIRFALMVITIAAVSCAGADKKADKPKVSGGSEKEYWEDKSLKGMGPKKNGQKNGRWTLYHQSTGEKLGEGDYLDDKQTGPWLFFHKNGQVSAKGDFIEEQKTGEWQWFYDTGEMMSKANYVIKEVDAGILKMKVGGIEGKKISYFKSGKVWKEEDHRDGLKNGRSQEYFENGSPKEIAMFEKNEYNGQFNQWFENGKKKSDGSFSAGQRVGRWSFYHDNGQLAVAAEFKANKPHGNWAHHARDGRVMKSGKYEEGKEAGRWAYYSYESGRQQVAMELQVSGGMVAGEDNRLFAGGVLVGTGGLFGLPKAVFEVYKNGAKTGETDAGDAMPDDPITKTEFRWAGKWRPLKKNGLWKEYFPGGKTVKSEAVYLMDNLGGKYKEYYPAGKLKAEGEFLNGKKNGQWKFYREDGSLIEDQSGNYMLDKKFG